jgi:pimeloyl-ACP methyl ester carboxylesterase
MHGYPDSYALWKHYLQNPRLANKATLIAVDLPGFGGSDSLDTYGPAQVLEAMAEFILKMREQYLTGESGRVAIVAHDWGAIIGFRLASEAPQLADRFIMSNCVHPPLVEANVRTRLASARQMARTWLHSPFNLLPLRRAFGNIAPLLRQIIKSGYVFVFNLPIPMANVVGNVGDFWWFRYLNAVSTHPDPSKPLTGAHGAEMLASSVGPSLRECSTAVNSSELAYSDSVRRRARMGGYTEKIGLYRHGLGFLPWKKSLETLWELNQLQQRAGRRRSSSSATLFDTSPEGSIKAPVTVIWGKRDIAIENAIALEGFRDYFAVKNSQLIMVSRCGHWSPLEKQGFPIFEEVIEWTITGEQGSLRNKLGDNYPLAEIITER